MRGTHVSAVIADRTSDLDLDKLLHPAQAFELPQQVVDDPDLTLNEKRAILYWRHGRPTPAPWRRRLHCAARQGLPGV